MAQLNTPFGPLGQPASFVGLLSNFSPRPRLTRARINSATFEKLDSHDHKRIL